MQGPRLASRQVRHDEHAEAYVLKPGRSQHPLTKRYDP
jgi:hypothetical protein